MPTFTAFDSSQPRPYRWTILISVEAHETAVADGFDPFDPKRKLSPYARIDHIVGNVDSWGEARVQITDVQCITGPDPQHVSKAQGYTEPHTVSDRDRLVLAEVIGHLLDIDDLNWGRLREFADSLRTDADGDHVKLAADIIASVEHPEV